MSALRYDRIALRGARAMGLAGLARALEAHIVADHWIEDSAGPSATPFELVMLARRDAWQAARADESPEVRAFVETHIFGEYGFARLAWEAYHAPEHATEEARIRAVYDLLRREDCPLLAGLDSPGLRRRLGKYFVREFVWAPPWSAGSVELLRAMPAYMLHALDRIRVVGGTRR